jgi:perosamine synthetase
MASGTAALHVALLVSGVEHDSEVILPTLTFVAPANAARYVGAWPVFVDVEPDYWQMNAAQLEAFLREDCERRDGRVVNRHTGRRVSAVLPVDILGHPCDLDAIHGLAAAYGLAVVEDATESLGARYRGRPLGQCSAISCFSFNGNKLITTGGGGMLVTDDETVARRARYLATQAKDDPLEYVHHEVGFNYRLTNVQAAIGCAQLEQLAGFLARKRAVAERYATGLASVPGIRLMRQAPWAESSWWLYTVLVDEQAYGMESRALLRFLAERGIQTRPLWQPMHRSPAHGQSYARPCPVGERVHRYALSLPCSTGLTEQAQERVIGAIRDARVGT